MAGPAMRRALLCTGTLATLGLLAAGCGGSRAPAVANVGTSTASASAPAAPAPEPVVTGSGAGDDSGSNPDGGPAAIFDQCLRTHGVPNMPGPSPGLEAPPPGVNPNSPQFEQAERECASLVPADAPPSLVAHPVGPLLAFAKCMRAHGIASFPDPDDEGHFPLGQMQGLDRDSPLVRHAYATCDPLADGEAISPAAP